MKKPVMVATMNFFVWGTGYLYLGRAWGFWWTLIALISTVFVIPGEGVSLYNISVVVVGMVISIVLAWHGYKMAKAEERKKRK